MADNKLLTIAIPTYNGAKTITNVLDLLLCQYDERVEILISDNASTDETEKIIEDYLNDYPYIKYIRNDNNIGPDSNFLQCMEMSEGKYTLLLSDDDVLVEGSLRIILDFLEKNGDMSLVYLNAAGFRERYIDIEHCVKYDYAIYDNKEFITDDRKLFMRYAGRMWGFLSCFLWLTKAFRSIEYADEYKGTNWLQSYIHIICSQYGNKNLGIIAKICIGAGIYNIVSNFNSGVVDGINYRKMLDFAVEYGNFDKRQLDKLFVWRICFISKRAIIKERAAGVKKTYIRDIFKCTVKYPSAWFRLYPVFLFPAFVCRIIVNINNRIKSYSDKIRENRVGDIVG